LWKLFVLTSLGISAGRSYSKKLDRVLKRYRKQDHVERLSTEHAIKNLLEMMLVGRIDYTISHSPQSTYASEQIHAKGKFISLPTREAGPMINTHVLCTKNEWGRKIIEKINKALLIERPTELYRGYYEKWLPQNLIPIYRKEYLKFIKLTE